MDSNQDDNLNNSNQNWKIKITISVLLFLLTLIPVYFYLEVPTRTPSTKKSTILQKDTETLVQVQKNTSQENINTYLRELNDRMNYTQDENELRTLKLRKAMFLSINQNDNFSQNFKEATDIFVEIINSSLGQDDTTLYYRNFSIIGLAWLNVQCCDSETAVPYLFSKDILGINFTFTEHKRQTNNVGLSKYLALMDFLETVNPYFKLDVTYKRTMIDIQTRLLTVYLRNLDKPTASKIITKLKTELDNFSGGQKLTNTDPITTGVGAESFYFYGYDIYKQRTNALSETENQKINQNYQEINDLLLNPPKDIDPVGLNVVIYFNNLRYILSLEQRYKNSEMQEKLSELVSFQLKLINTNPDIYKMARNYFLSQEYKIGQLPGHAYFASLRTKYKEIDVYLKSIGV